MIRANGSILFSDEELACKATGIVRLAPGFVDELKALRLEFARPMTVTSCCRSAEHNTRIGGHGRSLHVYDHNARGLDGAAAIDVLVPARDRGPLVMLAWQRGWSVGVARAFVHLDRRDFADMPQMLFGYG